jgi:hypothetical protein
MAEGAEKSKKKEKKVVEEEKTPKKEEVPDKAAEQPSEEKESPVVAEQTEKKPGKPIGSRIKNWVIILLLLFILVTAGTFALWRIGVNDLKDDNYFLIVVQDQGVAKAGSVYDLSSDTADIINVEELPAVTNLRIFLDEGECKWQRENRPDLIDSVAISLAVENPTCTQILSQRRVIDRLLVINVGTVEKLSTEPFLEYNGKKIPSRDVGGYIVGTYWDVTLAGEDPPWKFRANLLSEWVELYSDMVLDASFGSTVYNVIFGDYRSGAIMVYPRNAALVILKFIPIEQIFL